METWEFRTVVVTFTGPTRQWSTGHDVYNSVDEALNAEGAQGWELVSAVPAEWHAVQNVYEAYKTFGYRAFFKRRKP